MSSNPFEQKPSPLASRYQAISKYRHSVHLDPDPQIRTLIEANREFFEKIMIDLQQYSIVPYFHRG
jgi:hypothetical protein